MNIVQILYRDDHTSKDKRLQDLLGRIQGAYELFNTSSDDELIDEVVTPRADSECYWTSFTTIVFLLFHLFQNSRQL